MVTLIGWLVGNALVVAALVPVVWLLSGYLRRRPAVQHLLWFLLLVKLVAPPMVDWPWSIERLMKTFDKPPQILTEVDLDTPHPPVDLAATSDSPELTSFEPQVASDVEIALGETHERADTGSSIYEVAGVMWAIGTAVLLIFGLAAVWRQRKLLHTSVPAPDHLLAVVARVARQLGVRPPQAAVSSQISTPMVSCLGRPRLVWPAEMSEPESVSQCEAVVAHEMAHLARRDHYFLYFESLVRLCSWWNPLVWIIRRRLRETRELACDALALAAVETPRSDYAQRLLSLSVSRVDSLVFAPAFGAGQSRRFLKRRLAMVFDERVGGRISAGGVMLALLLILVGLPCLTFADPPVDKDPVAKSDAAPTTEATQSSSSSATSGSSTASADSVTDPVTQSKFARSFRLSQVLKTEDISREKPAEISLGNGGIIRIGKNEKGDLIVTVEQTENSNVSRTIRVGPAKSGRIIVDATTAPGKNSTGGVIVSGSVDAAPSTQGALAGGVSSDASGSTIGALTGSGTASTSAGSTRALSRRVSGASARTAGGAANIDGDMLRSDVELAKVGVMEKQAELEIARKSNADEAHLRLAELGVRRAEIELQRAELRLKRSEAAPGQ
jgi:beta-lactamase regulating signal transducer with metallopeptidase domain